MRASILVATAVLGSIVLNGCGSGNDNSSDSGAQAVTITAADITFSPTDVPVTPGKVAFTLKNTDQVEHNLTIGDLSVNQDVEGGKSATVTVTVKAGTFPFHCKYHPDKMKGTITAS